MFTRRNLTQIQYRCWRRSSCSSHLPDRRKSPALPFRSKEGLSILNPLVFIINITIFIFLSISGVAIADSSGVDKETITATVDLFSDDGGITASVSVDALFAPGEILVKFKTTYSAQEIAEIATDYGSEALQIGTLSGIARMSVPWDRTMEEMVEEYEYDPRVAFSQPNPVMKAFYTEEPFIPNDPVFPSQTNLFLINMPEAWLIQTGRKKVKVAVLDTGVAFEETEIDPSDPLFSRGFTNFVQAPDLEKTRFPKFNARDFVNRDRHANDDADPGHGTLVSGIIAQSTDNGIGSAGIAFDTKIMPIKVLDRFGSGTLFNLIEGLLNAINRNVDVINMSLGFSSMSSLPVFDPLFAPLDEVIQQAHDAGIVLVAASGNESIGIVSRPALNPNVIAVGASNFDGITRSSYSQHSGLESGLGIPPTPGLPGSIEIVAPVGDLSDKDGNGIPDAVIHQSCLCSTNPTEFFNFLATGTSFASPQVAAAVALLIANGQRPSEDGAGVEALRQILRETARDLGDSGIDTEFGAGQLDVLEALKAEGLNQ